jgi:hypothetical protein
MLRCPECRLKDIGSYRTSTASLLQFRITREGAVKQVKIKVANVVEETAAKAVRLAAAELGLPGEITIEWFDVNPPGSTGSPRGEAWASRPQTIFLKTGMSEISTLETIGHELRHLWQWRHDLTPRFKMHVTTESHLDGEADARGYAREFVDRFYSGRAGLPVYRPFAKRESSALAVLMKEAQELLGGCK